METDTEEVRKLGDEKPDRGISNEQIKKLDKLNIFNFPIFTGDPLCDTIPHAKLRETG